MGAVSIIYVPFLILLRTVYDKQVWKNHINPRAAWKSTSNRFNLQPNRCKFFETWFFKKKFWYSITKTAELFPEITFDFIYDQISRIKNNQKSLIRPRPLTTQLAAWPLRGHTALKSILWETLFLDQQYDFSLIFLNSFLHSFVKSNFMEKIPWHRKIHHFSE